MCRTSGAKRFTASRAARSASALNAVQYRVSLFGFVILKKQVSGYRLTYEDIDLLRTSGRQVASYLAQHYISRRLSEAQQFETYGRMTAFLMHDLKNIIAQQSLLVQNAVRHKHNPSFIDDAIVTIEDERFFDQL